MKISKAIRGVAAISNSLPRLFRYATIRTFEALLAMLRALRDIYRNLFTATTP
ncbi:hypothetical protein [Dyadobacter beijingensis]|uniref:hypothetical protein n=1 Tax=Dyadobacter beijingensis TaxID=365489 RepID=UPI00039A5242|nr:hypothetical protein [Dyadobacter beijingensis]